MELSIFHAVVHLSDRWACYRTIITSTSSWNCNAITLKTSCQLTKLQIKQFARKQCTVLNKPADGVEREVVCGGSFCAVGQASASCKEWTWHTRSQRSSSRSSSSRCKWQSACCRMRNYECNKGLKKEEVEREWKKSGVSWQSRDQATQRNGRRRAETLWNHRKRWVVGDASSQQSNNNSKCATLVEYTVSGYPVTNA